MARRTNMEELIHCDVCGEEYSPTYRRCPFCGEKPHSRPVPQDDDDFDDGYVFDGQKFFDEDETEEVHAASKGGKRLANGGAPHHSSHSAGGKKPAHGNPPPRKSSHGNPPPRRPSGGAPGPMNWMRIITFVISLVIIIAALIIIFTVIYPSLHKAPDATPTPSSSVPVVTDPVEPPVTPSTDPQVTPSTDPVVDSPASIKLSHYDFTLNAGKSHTVHVIVEPTTWDGEIVWSSSDENYATVASDGTVTNVNETNSLRKVIITATAGEVSQQCTVYCRGKSGGSNPPPVETDKPKPSQNPSGGLQSGDIGVIVNADGGLNVRSGPGTSFDVVASVLNGNRVSIVSAEENGWIQIDYNNGRTGFIKAEYVTKSK